MMGLLRALALSLSLAAALGSASAVPRHARIKRQVSQLRNKYDFIIVGGGTSGLTVADRLSEAFPNRTVLVIEYGEIEFAPGVFDPPTLWITPHPDAATAWTFNSLPNPEANNKTAFVQAGQVVGGSSAVNGMFFDRPSRFDHDAWTEIGGVGYEGWDWDGIYPYFKKSVTFTEPSAAVAMQYGYTWDTSAYGGSTPIHSSYPPFQWDDQPVLNQAWLDMGIRAVQECADGDKDGICWVPGSQDPVTSLRSHAGLGHYADVIGSRSNYDLLVKHQVIRVKYKDDCPDDGPPRVEVRSLEDDGVFEIKAKKEVVISAGALHTPTVLQRSGIGPAGFLGDMDIDVVLDLPGVGSNFQDHSGPVVTWNFSNPDNWSPVPSDMENATYQAAASSSFDAVPATGPYTLSGGNSAIYVPLPNMTTSFTNITTKILNMVSTGSASSYLPPSYSSDPTMIAGYEAQLLSLASMLANPKSPSMETPWATYSGAFAFLLHPLSRGTVRLDPTDHLSQPVLDYRSLTNPVDMDLHIAHLRFLRTLVDTTTMQGYGATETAPGTSVQSDEDLEEYVKESIILSFMHPCCTASMMPLAKGGVVGADLKVHGAEGLRVADMSVMPLVPASHLSAEAYAVGEKAADIIIAEWS